MAYWSIAESINRRSFRIRLAWERFRARKNPGKAMAASNAIIATTIIISTRVNPFRLDGEFIVLEIFVFAALVMPTLDMIHRTSLPQENLGALVSARLILQTLFHA